MNTENSTIPSCMTIAGSDSGGEAGIQADLQAFNFFKVHGLSAITCATAQNPQKIISINPLSHQAIIDQISSNLNFFAPRYIKTGLLFTAALINWLSQNLQDETRLIIDPLITSTSGKALLEADAQQALINKLLPKAFAITPNIPEAEILVGRHITSQEDAIEAAIKISQTFNCITFLKGGHLGKSRAIDILHDRQSTYILQAPEVPILSSHGTGCRIASSFCASLAKGETPITAAVQAKAYTLAALNSCKRTNSQWIIQAPSSFEPNLIRISKHD